MKTFALGLILIIGCSSDSPSAPEQVKDTAASHSQPIHDVQVDEQRPTFESELTRWSKGAFAVGVVKVVSIRSFDIKAPPFVASEITVQPLKALRGSVPGSVTVRGGMRSDGHEITSSESPRVVAGKTYLAFFWNSSEGPDLTYALPMLDADKVAILGKTVSVTGAVAAALDHQGGVQ